VETVTKQRDAHSVQRYDHGRENLESNPVNMLSYDEEEGFYQRTLKAKRRKVRDNCGRCLCSTLICSANTSGIPAPDRAKSVESGTQYVGGLGARYEVL
jgi:hypothetical protein